MPQGMAGLAISRRQKGERGVVSIRANVAGPSMRGTFSTPKGVRRGWSLSAVSIRANVAGRSMAGDFSTPEGAQGVVPHRGRYAR
eukprot:9500816-Pyramimonas_sp.AAC.1